MNSNELINLICDLSNLCGVSSDENDVSNYISHYFKGSQYEIEKDAIGNLLLYRKDLQDKGYQKVILFAHMDEVGFIIRKIEENGFLKFERVGGVNTQILPGTQVVIKTETDSIEGVIGVQGHHFMPSENKFKIPSIQELYIDAFLDSKSQALEKGIEVGQFVSFKPNVSVINDSYIVGKSMDNRAAASTLISVAKSIEELDLNKEIYFCFPVMEEFNIRGIMPIIRRIQPDISIGLDVTVACDTPDLNYNDIGLNLGPAITAFNFHGRGTLAGVLPNKKLFNRFKDICKTLNIPYQIEVAPGVITENAFILFENEGVRVANLSIPTRYTHTPIETVHIEDVQKLVKVLNEFLKGKESEG